MYIKHLAQESLFFKVVAYQVESHAGAKSALRLQEMIVRLRIKMNGSGFSTQPSRHRPESDSFKFHNVKE